MLMVIIVVPFFFPAFLLGVMLCYQWSYIGESIIVIIQANTYELDEQLSLIEVKHPVYDSSDLQLF